MAPSARGGSPRYVLFAFLLAVAGLILVALPGLLYRGGLLDLGAAFTGIRWGAYVGGAGAVLCLVAGIAVLLRARGRGIVLAFAGLVAGAVALYLPMSMRAQAQSVPPIHDISTDVEDPPAFVAIAPLRADAPNPVDYAGPETASQQRAAYPDLVPLALPAPPAEAFARAEAAAAEMGWEIVAVDPADGRIEATATTRWFGFKDDVVIRIREGADGTGSIIDVRSKSRVGRSDLGANAARIRAFLDRL